MLGKIKIIAALILLGSITAAAEPVHRGPITDLLIYSNRILSCSQAGVMSTSLTGEDKRWLSQPDFRIYSLATISDHPDQVLLGGGLPAESGILAILDMKTGTLIAERKIGDDLIYSVAVDQKSRTAAAACADGAVIILKLKNFHDEKTATPHLHTATARDVAFSPDGSLLASCGHDGVVLVSRWKNATTAKPLILAGHTGPVHCLTFSTDSKRIASGSLDGKVRLHSIKGSLLRSYSRLNGEVSAICWSKEGTFAGTAGGVVYHLAQDNALSSSIAKSVDPVFSLMPLPKARLVIARFSLNFVELPKD